MPSSLTPDDPGLAEVQLRKPLDDLDDSMTEVNSALGEVRHIISLIRKLCDLTGLEEFKEVMLEIHVPYNLLRGTFDDECYLFNDLSSQLAAMETFD